MIKRIFATCRLLPCTMEAGALPDLYKILFDLYSMIHGLLRISCSHNPKITTSSYHKTDKTSSKVLLYLVDLFSFF